VLAALELTPTSAFFSSTRSRRVSVPSRHSRRLRWRHAPLARGTPERPGARVDTGLQAALSAWACHTGAAPGVPRLVRAYVAPRRTVERRPGSGVGPCRQALAA